jgi:hypothetical protein
MTNTRSDANLDQLQLDQEKAPTHLDTYTHYIFTTNDYIIQNVFDISNEAAHNEIKFYFIINEEGYEDIYPNISSSKKCNIKFSLFKLHIRLKLN